MTIEQERRGARRFSVQAPTEYENSGHGSGFTEDVSLSGVRVEHASRPISIEAELQLRFSFYHGSFETLFAGTVVRRTNNGFAVQFGSLNADQLGVLRRALSLTDGLP